MSRPVVELKTSWRSERGFSLPETLVASSMILAMTGSVMTGVLNLTRAQQTVWNRTALHSGVRSATELMQQEVSQAGRITLPAAVTLSAPVGVGVQTVAVSSAAGMFVNEYLTLDSGVNLETVQITALDTVANPNTITGMFTLAHANGVSVNVYGGF